MTEQAAAHQQLEQDVAALAQQRAAFHQETAKMTALGLQIQVTIWMVYCISD